MILNLARKIDGKVNIINHYQLEYSTFNSMVIPIPNTWSMIAESYNYNVTWSRIKESKIPNLINACCLN